MVLSKVIDFIQLSRDGKPFDRKLKGDIQIAILWKLTFKPIPHPEKSSRLLGHGPPKNFVKLNTDGAFFLFTHQDSSGGFIRDETGRILKAYQAFIGNFSVVYSELLAIWMGLRI